MNIWCLWLANNKNLSLVPDDLDYFETHFAGEPMVENWHVPPLAIDGKKQRLCDFVSWMVHAPVCSKRAKECLEPLIASHVEFLPLIQLRGKPYFAINVLKLVDCLDRQRSKIYDPSDPSRMLSIRTYWFRPDADLRNSPIFKVPEYRGQVFVTQPFVDAVIAHRLTGAAFGDPGVNRLGLIMKGQSLNVVPVVPE